MLRTLENGDTIRHLFEGWQETLIYSCLDGTMGKLYVAERENPQCACAAVGCFRFYGGKADKSILFDIPHGFHILVPQNRQWNDAIEKLYPDAVKVTRYATRKNTKFDTEKLKRFLSLPSGYRIAPIDGELYDACLEKDFSRDFVSSFENKEQFLRLGRGFVVLKEERIVSGASSYTRYRNGIEIEIDTAENERKNGLATSAASALILQCLSEKLYPSWDAQNKISLHLAEKLGYRFSHEYTAYELTVQ